MSFPYEQESSENDGWSNVYDPLEFKVISDCCYTDLQSFYQYLPVFTWIYLYLPVFTWIYLYLPLFNCIYLNLSVFTGIYLNLPEFTGNYMN